MRQRSRRWRPAGFARRSAGLLLLAAGFGCGSGIAQDLEPRQYTNIPVGLNFLLAGVSASDGNVLVDPSIALEDAALEVDGPILGYARSLAFAGLSTKLDAGLARVCLSGSATYEGQRVERDVCGLTDAKMRWSINFVGAPALRLQQFPAYRQDLVVGASLTISAPVGDYDPDRLVNIGANRWAAKLEVGLSKVVRRWSVDLALAGTFFEENDEFFGGQTREQDPIYSLQAHVVRAFRSGIWIAVDTTHYRGGRTITDGILDENRQSNSRLGLTVSLPVTRSHSLKLHASRGVSTRTGSDFDTLSVAWQYRWGGS